MSKSALYAHFGSKQGLQLATVEEAGGSSPKKSCGPLQEWLPQRSLGWSA
jgi:AcrR family transcriptional regulator